MGIVAVPIEPIPGLDVLYDIGAPIFLIYYWVTFVRDAIAMARMPPPPPPPPDITRRVR